MKSENLIKLKNSGINVPPFDVIKWEDRNKPIDLLSILDKTKYGKDGIGGIKCNGLMYVGFPR